MIDSYLPRFDLFQQLVFWLNRSMHGSRRGRHYLESNPALVENEADRELARLITAEAEDMPEMKQQMNYHLALLQDARRRGGTLGAIREAYVDRYGGFALDLPPWLEQIEQQRLFLNRLGRPERTKKAHIDLLRNALAQAWQDKHIARETIAELHNDLGGLLLRGPYPASQIARLNALIEAIACHKTALSIYISERYPLQHAKTQIYLGVAYQQYGLAGPREAIEDAIASYERALRVYTPDVCSEQWIQLQTYLGNAHAQRTSGDPSDNIEQAIAYHRSALRGIDRLPSPALAASVRINLGDAYRQRIIGTRAGNLKQATTCYRAALQTFDRQNYPQEWASIHNRLAAVYQESGADDQDRRDRNLRCAIVCYEAALEVYAPDTFPVERASTLANLGNIHRLRSSADPLHNLDQAIECYLDALQVFTYDAFPIEHQRIVLALAASDHCD